MNIELIQKLGNIHQLAGAREVTIARGPGKGLDLIEIYNAAGLRFTVMPDCGLDILDFSYKGVNLAYHSKNGLSVNRNPAEDEFFQAWPGGILTTCGLANVGDACIDNGVHPCHGRIGRTPARHISVSEGWHGDDYIISVSGEVMETRLYGRVLSLRRKISVGLYDKMIKIEDTISNENSADENFMLLYHVNFGHPLLDISSKVVCSEGDLKPYNDQSKDYSTACKPGAEAYSQMFLLETESACVRAAVINPDIALGGFIEYDAQNLPYLWEWKNMMKQDYVIALEPSNCMIMGRARERENNTLRTLPAYSSINNYLKLGALEGKDELEVFSSSLHGRFHTRP